METKDLVGFRRCEFKTDDGRVIHGWNFYFIVKMDPSEWQDGMRGEKAYIPDNILAESGYTPHVGDTITLVFNRYGKVSKVYLE